MNTISAGTIHLVTVDNKISHTRILPLLIFQSFMIVLYFLISGPLRSRAAKAIGFIDMMIDYSSTNAPLQKELSAGESTSIFDRFPSYFYMEIQIVTRPDTAIKFILVFHK